MLNVLLVPVILGISYFPFLSCPVVLRRLTLFLEMEPLALQYSALVIQPVNVGLSWENLGKSEGLVQVLNVLPLWP